MYDWIFIIPGAFSCNAQHGVDVPPHWKFSYFMGCSSKEKPPVHRSLLREAWEIAILWRLNIFNPCNFHTIIFDLWTMLFISKYWPIKMTLRTLRIFFQKIKFTRDHNRYYFRIMISNYLQTICTIHYDDVKDEHHHNFQEGCSPEYE